MVAGNCQASFLYRALTRSAELTDRYELVYFRNFRKGDQDSIKRRHVAGCAVLLEQVAHNTGKIFFRDALPADCATLRFPILWMNSLWPTQVRDRRIGPSAPFDTGLYPYGDQVMLDLLQQGLEPAAAARRWLETDLGKVVDLDRFHEINVEKHRQLDDRSELKLGAEALAGFRRSRLFLSNDHPTRGLLRRLRDLAFEALGVAAPADETAELIGGMEDVEIPVHPSVAAHFRLAWHAATPSWRWRDRRYTTEEFMRRYAQMDFGVSAAAARPLQPAL